MNYTPQRLEWLDALRCFAILGVILVHIPHSNLPWIYEAIVIEGARGVQLFFIISAFSVFWSLKHLHPMDHGKTFLIRRFFKIAPLFYIILFYSIIVKLNLKELNLDMVSHVSFAEIVSNFLFLNGLSPYWIDGIVPGSWAIATIMLFYIIIYLVHQYVTSLKRAVILALICFQFDCFMAFYLVQRPLINDQEIWHNYLFMWLPNQLPIFCLGIISYYLYIESKKLTPMCISNINTRSPILKGRFIIIISIVTMIIITILNWMIRSHPINEHQGIFSLAYGSFLLLIHPLFFGLSFMMLTYGIMISDLHFSEYIQYIGRISYSCYLNHFLILDFINKYVPIPNSSFNFVIYFILILICTIALSSITYKYIEVYGVEIGKRFIKSFFAGQA